MKNMVRTIAVLCLLTLPAGFLHAGASQSKIQPAAGAKAAPGVDHQTVRPMSPANASSTPLLQSLSRGPLRFEANAGQFAPEVKFVSRGINHTLFLTPGEAVLALPGRPIEARGLERFSRHVPQYQRSEGAVARLRLVGANAAPEIAGTDLLPGKSNYILGDDPKRWRTGIAQYARVRYKDVYPGIDWVYYGNEGQLEYDLVVAPGADPDRITLAMEITRGTNTEALRLDENGDLLLATRDDAVRFHRPRVYQEIDGQKQFIAASYELRPQGQVGFKLGSYDHSQTLVIDPFLSFSTYVGGTATDQGYAVASDASGNIYVTGASNSVDFPLAQRQPNGTATCTDPTSSQATLCAEAFVTKIAGTGALVFSTYIGGSGFDSATAIAVDSNENAYITGFTNSQDFPIPPTANYFENLFNAGTCTKGGVPVACNDAFVVKLDPTGTNLLYSTYLGTNGEDDGTGIALDPTSPTDVFVVGYTSASTSTAFQTTPGAYQTTSGGGTCGGGSCADGFMVQLDLSKAGATSLAYSTYLGGSGDDFINAVTADLSGDVYVVGSTTSANFPTKNPFSGPARGGFDDAFLAMLSPDGLGAADLKGSTYIGGNGQDEARAVTTVSGAPDVVYVAGITNSNDAGYATSGAPQTLLDNTSTPPVCSTHICADGFMMKFDLSTGVVQRTYSTYIGGSGDDSATTIAADTFGNAFVAGWTNSADLTLSQPVQSVNAGGYDAFITRFDLSGARNYATYLGGSDTEAAYGIAVDSNGNTIVVGDTYSTDFLVTPGAAQLAIGGGSDLFVAKLGPGATGAVLVSPASLTFSGEGVGNTSSALMITLRNTGSGNVTGVTATKSGADASDFTPTLSGCAPLAGGSTCTVSVTFKPGAVGARSASLSISYTGASGSIQSVTLAGTGQDFDFVSQTATQTVPAPAGSTAQYTLTVTPQGGFGFDNAVSFSCTGLPTGAACAAPSVTPGATAKNSTLSISTTRRSLAPPMFHPGPLAPATPVWFGNPWLAALLLALLLTVMAGMRQRRAGLVLAAGLLVLLTWTACGGGGGGGGPPPPTGTPAGTYTITVSAKSGSLTHPASVTLVVQ